MPQSWVKDILFIVPGVKLTLPRVRIQKASPNKHRLRPVVLQCAYLGSGPYPEASALVLWDGFLVGNEGLIPTSK